MLRYNHDHMDVNFAYQGAPDHYVNFNWSSYPNGAYVLVEDMTGWKSLGSLRKTMLLPEIIFSPYSKIKVQTTDVNGNPKLLMISTLVRGGHYTI